MEHTSYRRVDEIRNAVRGAVSRLGELERRIIEGYYFDGMSFGRMAEHESVSLNRIVTAHRQAIRNLRELLAPFVARTFGIEATVVTTCPICTASWRADAEAIIDAKTADMTWGQVVIRIERATGWRAASPQVLIMHQRKHGSFQVERSTDARTESTRESCDEIHDLDGIEDEFGTDGQADEPAVGGCMPNSAMDGDTDLGGVG